MGKLVINYKLLPGNQINVNLEGDLTNWPLLYKLLDATKDIIATEHSKRMSAGAIVAAPADALNGLPPQR